MEKITLTELVNKLHAVEGSGHWPVVFEDENGKPLDFAEVYAWPSGQRYVVVLSPAKVD